MGMSIKLTPSLLVEIRKVDEKLMSYNIEMTEVTGGTFWKEYTPEQIAGAEEFPQIKDMSDLANLMQVYPPVDLYNERLRGLAKELGPVWVRIGGNWATKTYYDLDNHTDGVVPEGFQSVLTESQWKSVLDFVKYVDAKLLVSFANCEGIHKATGKWEPDQARLLLDYSIQYGVPINAVEFMNEPNLLEMSGAPSGYTVEDYNRDQDACVRFIRENYPDVLVVGPSVIGDKPENTTIEGNVDDMMGVASTWDIINGTKEPLDVYSYHYYNGISERIAMMGGHWLPEQAHTENYLSVAPAMAHFNSELRDAYVPNGPMWVTESGDAGGGGDTWASTYLDVLRTANELGSFSEITDGIIFHNTLCSSDYGFLHHRTFEPRPNYWFVYLWNKLMGNIVYDTREPIREGAHVYAHSRKDGKEGAVYLIINNSLTEKTAVSLPKNADIYTLSADDLRSREIKLNGKVLDIKDTCTIPELRPSLHMAGTLELAPATVTFIVL